jgi:ribosome-associated protein
MNSPTDPEDDKAQPPAADSRPQRWSTDPKALEKEVEYSFIRGSGPGGQHRNKVETGVRLHHLPSGITITATAARSQKRNKELAMSRLIEKLRALNYRPPTRRKTRPTRGSIRRRLDAKKRRSDVKSQRQKPED